MVFKKGKLNPRRKATRQLRDNLMEASERGTDGDATNRLCDVGKYASAVISNLQPSVDDALSIDATNSVSAAEKEKSETDTAGDCAAGKSGRVALWQTSVNVGIGASGVVFSRRGCQPETPDAGCVPVVGTLCDIIMESSESRTENDATNGVNDVTDGVSTVLPDLQSLLDHALLNDTTSSVNVTEKVMLQMDTTDINAYTGDLFSPVECQRGTPVSGPVSVSVGNIFRGQSDDSSWMPSDGSSTCTPDLEKSRVANRTTVFSDDLRVQPQLNQLATPVMVTERDYDSSRENTIKTSRFRSLYPKPLTKYNEGSILFVENYRKRRRTKSASTKKRKKRSNDKGEYNTSGEERLSHIRRRREADELLAKRLTGKSIDRFTLNHRRRINQMNKLRQNKYKLSLPYRRSVKPQALASKRYMDWHKNRSESARPLQVYHHSCINRRATAAKCSATLRRAQHSVAVAKECLGKRRKLAGNLDFLLRRREKMRNLDGMPLLPRMVKGTAEDKRNRFKRWQSFKIKELIENRRQTSNVSQEDQQRGDDDSCEESVHRMFRQLLNYQRQQMKEFYRLCSKLSFLHQTAEAEMSDVVSEEKNGKLEAFYGKLKYHVATHESQDINPDNFQYVPYEEVFPDEADTMTFKQLRLKIRLCESHCAKQIPSDWSVVLHERISKFSKELEVKELLHNVHLFEHCLNCNLTGQLCVSLAFCSDTVSSLLRIRPHYVGIRTLMVDLYKIRRCALQLHLIELLMSSGTYSDFMEFKAERFPDKVLSTDDVAVVLGIASDEAVKVQYGSMVISFRDMVRKSMDIHECFHCLRLVGDSNIQMFKVEEQLPFVKRNSVKASIQDYEAHFKESLTTVIVCNVCYKLLSAKVPFPSPYSYRNAMWPCVRPDVLRGLNTYERQLISFVKCFQRIVKLSPMRFKGLSNTLARAIKGISVHLPLPRGSLKKVSEIIKGDIVLPDCSRFMIQVDSLPNLKAMTVFRSLVDVSAVMEALNWMKENNFLYKDVRIDSSLMLIPQIIRTATNAESDEVVVDTEVSDGLLQSVDISNVGTEASDSSAGPGAASVENPPSTESFEVVATKQKGKKRETSFFDTLTHTGLVTEDSSGFQSTDSSLSIDAERTNDAAPPSCTVIDQSNTKSLPDGLKFHVPYVVPYKKYILEELKDNSSSLMHIPADEVLEEFSLIPMEKSLPKDFDLELFASKPISSAPLSWDDPHLDVACFPHLFCDGKYGLFHERTRLVTPAYYMEHRLRMSDARFRRDQPYVFDCALRKDMMSINASIYTMLNSGRFGDLTVGQLKKGMKDPENSPTLERNITTMLGTILGTPQYWTKVRRDLEAVIQQYGAATFFLTLSCCEYKSEDFKEFLILRNADVPNVKNTAIRNLLAIDPVSVSLHFHNKFTLFWDRIIMDPDGPLGCVERYYIKKEYQQRGAPHIHAMLWIRDAPVHGRDKDEDVLAFIRRHITCEIPDVVSSPVLHSLVTKHQTHACTKSCLRSKMVKGKFYCSYCRYGYPREVTDEAHLNTADEVLSSRVSGRRRQKLYSLVRRREETNINDYNPAVLTMWEANNDLQYIKDTTMALAYYTTQYVCKAEKQVMSEVARSVNTNLSAAGMAKQMLCKMLSNRQLGIFEAADKVLRHPLYRMSDQVKNPSIYLPSEQKRRLKAKSEIESMPDDSVDIFCNSFQTTYYPKRPNELAGKSAYEITQWYEVRYGQPKKASGLRIKGVNAHFSRRRTPAVVSIWQTKKDDDLSIERYCFQVLALFKPWRCYDDLLKDEQGVTYASYTEALNAVRHLLPDLQQHETSKKRFEDMIAWAKQVKFDAQARLESEVGDEALLNSIHDNVLDLDIEMAQQSERVRISLTEESVKMNYDALNQCQRYAFDLMMEGIKSESGLVPDGISRIRKVFVSGVGGTGKSFLIMALRQHLEWYYSSKKGPAVLVAAPTGVAAVNIDGVTIHKLLKLPVSKSKKSEQFYWPLHAQDAKILRVMFRNCKLLIIDEVSMLSNLYLTFVHKRLNEILIDEEQDPKARFGNLNVVLLGDLLQLPPVRAPHVFVTLTQEDIAVNFKAIGENVNLWRDFEFVELTENMRQRDDALYAQMLDRIRIGSPTSEDLDCLRLRLIYDVQGKTPDWPELLQLAVEKFLELYQHDASVLCLMPKNDVVNQFNMRVMELLKLQPITSDAEDTIDQTSGTAIGKRRSKKKPVDGLSGFQKRAIEQLPVADTGGLEDSLKLAVGARMMLRRNVDVKRKLVNGSIGVVRQIDLNPDTGKPELIHMQFQDVPGDTVISKVSANYCIGKGLFVQRIQFPFTLSYAITIHKCQGLSLHTVMVDIGESAFSDGMGYVALSRVKTLKNLHIIRIAAGLLKCNKYCVYEYDRLRKVSGIAVAPVEFNRNPEIEKWKTTVTISAASQKASLAEDVEMDTIFNDVSKASRRGAESKMIKKCKKKNVFVPMLPVHSGMYLKLSNNDGHSCFANAVVQCLLRCKDMWDPLRTSVDRSEVTEALLDFATNLAENNRIMSADQLREAFHNDIEFHPLSQQDCDSAEFLSKLIPKLPADVANMFAHEVLLTGECPISSCQQLNVPEDAATLYVNVGTELQLDRYNIKDLFADTVIRQFTCQSCRRYSQRFPFTVNHSFTNMNRYLILNCPVMAGSWVVGKTLMGIRERMLIYKVRWNLIACIQVCGLSAGTQSAAQVEYMREDVTKHYMAYVKHHDKEWVLLNDTSYTVFKYKPSLKNMVLLFFERAD